MKCFVTGATGFVGGHVARALCARGDEVRCLVRAASPPDNLAGLDAATARGDLRDFDSLRRAMRGAQWVFHCAADYRLWVPDPAAMLASNVDGTHNVLRAAAECGVERVVYTSTVGALGLDPRRGAADERTPVRIEDMIGPYKRSKFLAERVADEWVAKGLPVVIVNPSAPVGEADVKPTATGQMIVDFLERRMPVYVDTGLNLVDVRDVAQGHVLAAERGRPGEKYILGHRNMTLHEILVTLSSITGIPAPRVRVPRWLPLTVAAIESLAWHVTGKPPRVSLDAVRLARHHMYFDAGKAVRELGLPQTPIDQPLSRAVDWFRDRGYVRGRAAA